MSYCLCLEVSKFRIPMVLTHGTNSCLAPIIYTLYILVPTLYWYTGSFNLWTQNAYPISIGTFFCESGVRIYAQSIGLKMIIYLIVHNNIVGSAPGFPHGIVDPIEELGALASSYGICLHVDLCLGGFVLPFARKLGYPIPPFDFSVKGVTSISTDVHKYGLGPKGTSVVLYRNHEIRKHQFVAVTEWSGGLYVSPTMAGSRPGGLIAGAWAAMVSLGLNGYLENTRQIMEASKKILKGIQEIPELFVIGQPHMTVVAFGSNDVNIFEVNDVMTTKGWHLNALQRPNSVHICVTLQHINVYDDFLKDLAESVKTVKQNPGPISGGLAPLYGAAGKMPDRGIVQDLLVEFMDNSC